MPQSTVCAVLKRSGLGRLSGLQPPEPPNRYERPHAGELLHVDVKKLGRIARPGHRVTGRVSGGGPSIGGASIWAGSTCTSASTTRPGSPYAELLPDERGETAAGFLERACGWYQLHSIQVERVMTDNGAAYRSTCTRSPAISGCAISASVPLPAPHQQQSRAL